MAENEEYTPTFEELGAEIAAGHRVEGDAETEGPLTREQVIIAEEYIEKAKDADEEELKKINEELKKHPTIGPIVEKKLQEKKADSKADNSEDDDNDLDNEADKNNKLKENQKQIEKIEHNLEKLSTLILGYLENDDKDGLYITESYYPGSGVNVTRNWSKVTDAKEKIEDMLSTLETSDGVTQEMLTSVKEENQRLDQEISAAENAASLFSREEITNNANYSQLDNLSDEKIKNVVETFLNNHSVQDKFIRSALRTYITRKLENQRERLKQAKAEEDKKDQALLQKMSGPNASVDSDGNLGFSIIYKQDGEEQDTTGIPYGSEKLDFSETSGLYVLSNGNPDRIDSLLQKVTQNIIVSNRTENDTIATIAKKVNDEVYFYLLGINHGYSGNEITNEDSESDEIGWDSIDDKSDKYKNNQWYKQGVAKGKTIPKQAAA